MFKNYDEFSHWLEISKNFDSKAIKDIYEFINTFPYSDFADYIKASKKIAGGEDVKTVINNYKRHLKSVGEKDDDDFVEVFTMNDCIDEMLENARKGLLKGSTTHIDIIDKCWKWRPTEFSLFTGYNNDGKALDIKTDIPTKDGFKKLSDIVVGDVLFDEEGTLCNVIACTDIQHNRPCYKITFANGLEIIADENHEWFIHSRATILSEKNNKKRNIVLQPKGTDQQYKRILPGIQTTKQLFNFKKQGTNGYYCLDICKPVKYEKKQFIIPPYCFGAWLGDGDSGGGGYTCADQEIIDKFKEEGIILKKLVTKYKYSLQIPNKKTKSVLKELKVFKNKHIPSEYLYSSVEQRLELLKGLMDTDGSIDKLGRCEYCSVSEVLANDVKTLICSLGIKAFMSVGDAKLNGRFISKRYRIAFKPLIPVFNLKRKLDRQDFKNKSHKNHIKSIEKVESVPVKCIEVDSKSHLFLCTKEYIPTHNSLFIRSVSLIKGLKDNWKTIIYAPEDYPASAFFEEIIHTASGYSTDKDNPNYIGEKLYKEIYEKVKDYFTFVNIRPPKNTLEAILSAFVPIIEKEGCKICIIDPLVKITRPAEYVNNDAAWAAYVTSVCVDFARRYDVCLILVLHQLTPKIQENGMYAKPDKYSIKHGGNLSDSSDNVLFLQKPMAPKDNLDTLVRFGSLKIKKQKLVAVPQEVQFRYNRFTNRYITEDERHDLFDFDTLLGIKRMRLLSKPKSLF